MIYEYALAGRSDFSTFSYTSSYKNIKLRKHSQSNAINDSPTYQVIQKIQQLKLLPDNWDGKGASAIGAETISRAMTLVKDLFSVAYDNFYIWHNPSVTANVFGEVVFEWWSNDKKLTIYVDQEKITYLKVWGPDIFEDMEHGILETNAYVDVIAWLE